MNFALSASYTHCQRIARRSASSFYYSFLLLPKHKRLAMCALYSFLRRTDEVEVEMFVSSEPAQGAIRHVANSRVRIIQRLRQARS